MRSHCPDEVLKIGTPFPNPSPLHPFPAAPSVTPIHRVGTYIRFQRRLFSRLVHNIYSSSHFIFPPRVLRDIIIYVVSQP